jgi:hypothetical protein
MIVVAGRATTLKAERGRGLYAQAGRQIWLDEYPIDFET